MKNRWKYFRWTPRVAVIATMYGIVVPSAMGYLFYRTDVSCDSLPLDIVREIALAGNIVDERALCAVVLGRG